MGRLTKPAGIAALIGIAVIVITAMVSFAQQQIRLTTIMPTQTQMRGLSGVVGFGPATGTTDTDRNWDWTTFDLTGRDSSFYARHIGVGTMRTMMTAPDPVTGLSVETTFVVGGGVSNAWDSTMALVSPTRTAPLGMSFGDVFGSRGGCIGLVGSSANWTHDSRPGDLVIGVGGPFGNTHDLRLSTDNAGGPVWPPAAATGRGLTRIWIRKDGHVGIGPSVVGDPDSPCVDPGAAILRVNGEIVGQTNLNILNSGIPGDGSQVILRKDGNNVYLWPWSTGYANQRVMVGGGTPTDLLVSRDLAVWGAKNFEIPHPTKPNMILVHSTVEGPEIAVFYRGEAQLVNGKAKIILPEYFEALARKENRTIMITAKFEGDEPVSNLAASEIKKGSFFVKAVDDKNPSQKFYWEVKAERADLPRLVVEKKAEKNLLKEISNNLKK